jgi:TetR/AcrR family transcriptional regulator, cholesterol catabolism regulator
MEEERSAYDAKLRHILRSAAAVFARKGYHRASIRDVSREVGISLSGLYHYVKGKEELLFKIQDHAFGTVLENLDRALAGAHDPRTRLRRLIENHLRFFVGNMEEMKVLSHEADSLSGAYRRRVNARKRRYTELCQGILEELRPGAPVDMRVATFALFGMMNWIYNWYRPERDVGVEELVENIYQLFLRGYLAAGEPVVRPVPDGEAAESHPSIWRR